MFELYVDCGGQVKDIHYFWSYKLAALSFEWTKQNMSGTSDPTLPSDSHLSKVANTSQKELEL